MMGPRQVEQGALFYEFSLDAHVPGGHLLRSIDRFVDWEAMALTRRPVREYLDTLDEAAWGAASQTKPKFISRSDPAAQWTGALKGHAFFAYATNYLIDLDHAIIVDVEATRAIRQAEVGAARTMAYPRRGLMT